MPTTLTNTGPNLRAEGQREVLGSLMALSLTSLVLHAVLQANQFSPWPLLPESSSLPGMIWIIILLGLASYAVVFWVRAFRTCLDGANKIRANGADEAVIFASGIGSLCGLAIVVWIKGGKAGLWEWVGWMGVMGLLGYAVKKHVIGRTECGGQIAGLHEGITVR